jgi:hypothetical protein
VLLRHDLDDLDDDYQLRDVYQDEVEEAVRDEEAAAQWRQQGKRRQLAASTRRFGFLVRYMNLDDEQDVTEYDASWSGGDTQDALEADIGTLVGWGDDTRARVVGIVEQRGPYVTFAVIPQHRSTR